jgi:hypothetical protein
MFHNMELNIDHEETLLMVSNNRDSENSSQFELKEEETIHQLKDLMDIEKQSSH